MGAVRCGRLLSGVLFLLIIGQTAGVARAVDEGKTSYTAEAVCAFRSIGALDPDPRTRNPDHLAGKFVNPAWRQGFPGLGLDFDDAKIAMDRMNNGVFYYVSARTLHMDAMLKKSLKEGARQVVILGAGFDSRAYRFHEAYPQVRFFEIDLPATSADKQQRVAKILGLIPDWVTFVPIDFNTQTLDEVLTKAGFAVEQKTFYVWEGVTYFISEAGVDGTLRFIANHSAPGSRVVFDYMLEDVVQGLDYSAYGSRSVVFGVARRGEPYVFGIAPDRFESFVNLRGLALMSDLGPADLTQRYLIRSDGTVSGKIAEFIRIAHAEVPDTNQRQQLSQRAGKQIKQSASDKGKDRAHAQLNIPQAMQVFLNAYSEKMQRQDFATLAEHFSDDYLHRGRQKQEALYFLKHMYGSRPLKNYHINLTKLQITGNRAEIDGYIQRKGFRTPLMAFDLIKESDGQWRWYGSH